MTGRRGGIIRADERLTKMTTQEFELPVSCPTCKAIRTVWGIDRRYASDPGQEHATYKCGCRMECYLSHKRHDIREECPQNPAQLAKTAREKVIDEAVAKVLVKLKVNEDEAKAFAKRAERGTWSSVSDPSIFSYMRFPKAD